MKFPGFGKLEIWDKPTRGNLKGQYKRCACHALNYSPESKKMNFNDEFAEKYFPVQWRKRHPEAA